MRDPSRINRITNILRNVWYKNPDLRFFQFVHWIGSKTGLDDNSYELSYSRHVFEHLPTYDDILNEMIRVASKYVVHIFFIKPAETEKISYWEEENLYHNRYSKNDIENYLSKNSKVKSFEWLDINESENALVISLV
jgi:uncharacterized protein YihD (DUF1040 family)